MNTRLTVRRGFWKTLTISAAGCALSYPTTIQLTQDCEGNDIALFPVGRGDTVEETLLIRTSEENEYILTNRRGQEISRIRLIQFRGNEVDGPIMD